VLGYDFEPFKTTSIFDDSTQDTEWLGEKAVTTATVDADDRQAIYLD
jgi:hypothetical protein